MDRCSRRVWKPTFIEQTVVNDTITSITTSLPSRPTIETNQPTSETIDSSYQSIGKGRSMECWRVIVVVSIESVNVHQIHKLVQTVEEEKTK